jgi:hypothetical protein
MVVVREEMFDALGIKRKNQQRVQVEARADIYLSAWRISVTTTRSGCAMMPYSLVVIRSARK